MTLPLTLLLIATATATPPAQNGVMTVLGPKAYRDGDVIEITDVTATSPKLEQGDSVTVRGRVHLQSRDKANLCLFLTSTGGSGDGTSEATQKMVVTKGQAEFELKTTIKNRGALHLTFYDPHTGRPIGGTYFGTAEQMKDIADWDVSYYLSDDVVRSRPVSSRIPPSVWLRLPHSLRAAAKRHPEILDAYLQSRPSFTDAYLRSQQSLTNEDKTDN